MKHTLLIFSIFCSLFLSVHAQGDMDKIQVSILTCAPGNEIYSIYGHNAIRVKDDLAQTDIVYNYGTFDYKTPGFILKFMRGKLPYWISSAPMHLFLREYQYFEREVVEQVLDIDSLTKTKIIQFLAWNMEPENKEYKYDFFMDNCATRLRDIIDKNVRGFEWASITSHKTFRQIIKEYQSDLPWTDFGIDLIIGARADRVASKSEENFIPDYFANSLSDAKYKTRDLPLTLGKKPILIFNSNINKTSLLNFLISPLFLFLIFALIEVNILFRYLKGSSSNTIKYHDTIWIVLMIVCSCIMLFMWKGTDHIPTKDNWNLLWAAVLPIAYLGRKLKNEQKRFLKYVLLGILGICFVNALPFSRILPQYFNPSIAVIAVLLSLKVWRVLRN